MSNTLYQVVGECAHITEPTSMGPAKVLRYKGALVPADAPELKHLLDLGIVAKVGGDETGGVNADGVTTAEADGKAETPGARAAGEPDRKDAEQVMLEANAAGTGNGSEPSAEEKAAAELAERRKTAQDKLAGINGVPDGRASKDVLVEYLVQQGGSYDDLVKADKADLAEMVKSRQS